MTESDNPNPQQSQSDGPGDAPGPEQAGQSTGGSQESPPHDASESVNDAPADAEAVAGDSAAEDAANNDTADNDTGDDRDADENPLATVTAERAEYLDRWQRARADYDNLNKRRFKEVAEARDRGAAAVVDRLLEVLDNFGFALQAAESSEDTQLSKGVQLVHGQLMDALRQAGLDEVPGAGSPFDPAHHEAVISESDGTERDEPEVAEVLRTGYRFKTQLLRPASVKVAE
ncbi:hypothetical protein BH24ACT15_BH24ACT15_15690 [soil metagenome]